MTSKLIIPNAIKFKLKSHLKKGGVIAYPTESCYGLGVDPCNPKALKALLHLKKRPNTKGFIVIGANIKMFEPFFDKEKLTKEHYTILDSTWPAKTTFLIPCNKKVSTLLKGKHRNTLALRIPDHKGARNLSKLLNSPIVSTSANKSGGHSIKTSHELKRVFPHGVWILKGRIGKYKTPSKIIDLISQKRLR